ncbi:MAG: glycosyltransferase [Desulfobacter postgatei]|uniref:glycosyltransferase family 2 protein n=1 Tax=Desulfobacter postgatei TaxID=2293 RepID=UPI0023F1CC56|nr:glycosyltransferase [Desulfobacter postgatei]MDD4274563.1 glycosyltransferase [Desulfobacter postgatei]
MNKSSLVSVIMPCYNAEQFLEESVSSVLNQTYKNLELIVVDDGSTDRSLDILKKIQTKDKRLHIIQQKNKGPAPARNKGLKNARGNFIAFLDSDDFWDLTFIEKLEKALSSKPELKLGLAYCGWQNIGLSANKSKPFIPPDYNQMNLSERFLEGCRWPIHAPLIKKACFDKIGGFNEHWCNCEDYDLWLRMSPFIQVILVPEVLAFYRHHEGEQVTKNRALVARNHWKIQKKFISNSPDIAQKLGKKKLNDLTKGELLHRAYICYWDRDLDAAHKIFRMVIQTGYGRLKDLKYIVPAILPLFLYKKLIHALTRD